MAREVIGNKLESLRVCLARVRSTCPASVELLASNPDAQDIVAINLTRAVQLAVDIGAHILSHNDSRTPDTMGQTFELLAGVGAIDLELADRLRKAVGFRNIAIHSYETIDWSIVYSICTERLRDFDDFARAVTEAVPD